LGDERLFAGHLPNEEEVRLDEKRIDWAHVVSHCGETTTRGGQKIVEMLGSSASTISGCEEAGCGVKAR
jgi:hypothetical protein